MNIKILDCTLRDGGYTNNWNFGENTISSIISKLTQSNVDIIECGFLTDKYYKPGSTQFNAVEAIRPFIKDKNKRIMYVAMIALGEDEMSVENVACNIGDSIDGIRITFHEHEIVKACIMCEQLMQKGYKVFMQPVGTTTYPDESLINLINRMNELKPYAFYLVDTLGTMYKNDLLRLFFLVDHNLNENIAVGYHSHNNLQLSFANAQELIHLHTKRHLIIDSAVFGMGRGAGNLCTELLAQYINDNIENKYEAVPLLQIYDEHLSLIFAKYPWGYSLPYYLASVNHCHPNYAAHLLNKQTLPINILSVLLKRIPQNEKTLYNKMLIENIYLEYQQHKIDDTESMSFIRQIIGDRNILLLAPGKTIYSQYKKISKYIHEHDPIIISVNSIPEKYDVSLVFISNLKRFNNLDLSNRTLDKPIIVTSNIINFTKKSYYIVDYNSLIDEVYEISDNAGLMLLNLLFKIGIKEVSLAGFDGFSLNKFDNFYNENLINNVENEEIVRMNTIISKKIAEVSKKMRMRYITHSIYDNVNENDYMP